MDKKRIYLISDIHAYHKSILKYEPFRTTHFEEDILSSLERLPEGSTLINLGDIVFSTPRVFLCKYKTATYHLNSVLIRGNHEHKPDEYYDDYFDLVCTSFTKEVNNKQYIFTHVPLKGLEPNQINYHGHTHGNHRLQEFALTTNHRLVTYIIQEFRE